MSDTLTALNANCLAYFERKGTKLGVTKFIYFFIMKNSVRLYLSLKAPFPKFNRNIVKKIAFNKYRLSSFLTQTT